MGLLLPELLEFSLHMVEGCDGGISGSEYCYLGDFDASSNLEAWQRFGTAVRVAHSHAFVSSYMSFDEITDCSTAMARAPARIFSSSPRSA
ncbi:hypothetical protein AXG93_3217s1570 [Marchantia polymorpha subsp. ruderalis]|uniref:nicotinate phosphoribosyltransferase n=1 Tax=Marchantia polymorpha subsp. ruderalis TaxID=1480154 RepID=A0A176VWG3_MARPO|nr:hypothetical protein AXG93_3217s1570 [Marchantia polymorpha subsp. ruderalis]